MKTNHTAKEEHTMTTVLKSKKVNGYYITLSVEAGRYGSYLAVEAHEMYDESCCGYPIIHADYPMSEEAKAKRTFSRYCKKFSDQ
jgi:hypothetical protein